MQFYEVATDLLKQSGIRFSTSYLKERLEAHPDYPALSALTSLLDDFQVDYQTAQVDEREQLHQIPFPFLVHTIDSDGTEQFEVIRNKKSTEPLEKFYKRWTGVFLIIDENATIDHDEHTYYYKRENWVKWCGRLLITLFSVLLVASQFMQVNTLLLSYTALSLAGSILSIAIIFYSLGVETSVSQAFCKVQEKGCNTVLNSKLAKLYGDIGLADVAAVYFVGLLLFSTISGIYPTSGTLGILTFLSIIACAFTLVSLAYQARLKSWCKMCLMLTLTLWAQLALLGLNDGFNDLIDGVSELPANSLLLFAMSFCLAATWFLIKPLIIVEKLSLQYRLKIRKWRQNPLWFSALLPLHKEVDVKLWEREIAYGNLEGPLQIMVVSDPFCPSCAKAHKELAQVLEAHPDDIGVQMRFVLPSFNAESKKQQAVASIFSHYEQEFWSQGKGAGDEMKSIIEDWFEWQELEKWQEKYPRIESANAETEALIKRSIVWGQTMQISQTPAFFVNGHEMPNPHTFKDLFLFAADYIDILKSQQEALPLTQA